MRVYILIVAAALLSSCSKKEEAQNSSDKPDSLTVQSADSIAVDYTTIESYMYTNAVDTSDTETIDYDCAVIVSPNAAQVVEMKKEYGEDDFYTLADDAEYYQYEAQAILDSAAIKQVFMTSKRFVRFKASGQEMTLDIRKKGFPDWNIIFLKKDKKPKIVFAIGMNYDSIQSYFNK